MKLDKSMIRCSCGRDLPMHWYDEGLVVQKPVQGTAYCVYCAESEEHLISLSTNLRKVSKKSGKKINL